MYICMSRNLNSKNHKILNPFSSCRHCLSIYLSMAPPSSACSISNWDNKLTNHSNDRWSRLIQKKSTFRRCITVCGISLDHSKLQRGHVWRAFQYRCMIDCKIEANGVTPIPVAIKTACWARNIWLDGAPYGPSI